MSRAKPSQLRAAIATELNRRQFLVVGGTIAIAALPLTSTAASEPHCRSATPSSEALSDWTIDDMWGVYPRYATPIGFGRVGMEPSVALDPVDMALVPY